MSLKRFDRKFGADFLSGVPTSPGVYSVYDSENRLIYVGKARNLRKRLGQYRNAKRLKKHRKMREIVAGAERIEIERCATDLDACLLEARRIQEHRPRWNVAGAFYFLYPMIGLTEGSGEFAACFTTVPEKLQGFEFHGAFRSRMIAGEAFFSWIKLLQYVGHRAQRPAKTQRYSYVFRFRQIPKGWLQSWNAFWRGESMAATEALVLALVENAAARKRGAEIQEHLDNLRRFWRHEALPLARARAASGFGGYPVPQRERDLVFLKYRHALKEASPA